LEGKTLSAMTKSLFFRADVSPEVGLGHVRRCAVLAKACRMLGAKAHLMVRSRNVSFDSIGDWGGARLHEMPWDLTPDEDGQWVLETCREFGISKGVVDHYRLSEGYQERLIEAGLEWMQFGNKKHTHPLMGRWVHDASPGANVSAYEGRQKRDGTAFLLGPDYALVGSGFRRVRAGLEPPQDGAVASVLVTFGGGDDSGATLRTLRWLEEAGYLGRRVVLTGPNNPNLGELREVAERTPAVHLEVGNWEPAAVMAGNQLVICAGGTTLHEVACLGLPAVIVSIAENQVAPAVAWQAGGLGVYWGDLAGLEDREAVQKLKEILTDRTVRAGFARKAWEIQDGCGASRVAEALMSNGVEGD
jgi:UDP-2,4-diacetamido-2,4,6-trideoxy-beta-L-altropyranose hydrolase